MTERAVYYNPSFRYLSVWRQQADLPQIDHLPDRVSACAIQVLLKLPRLEKLAQCGIRLKGLPGHEVVLPPADLELPSGACGVCITGTGEKYHGQQITLPSKMMAKLQYYSSHFSSKPAVCENE